MSRIGKKSIVIPTGTQIEIKAGNLVTVKGAKGELTRKFDDKFITFEQNGNEIVVNRANDTPEARSLHGLSRTLLNNMVEGVTNGFKKNIVINGVGYKASKSGDKLILDIGFSHNVEIADTDAVKTKVISATEVEISGCDKEAVGQFAANIRDIKRCEPYHGYGIRYSDEVIRRKEGSKTAGKK